MAKTMKAAFVEKFGEPLKIREVPIPDPGPGEALVEVVASGVCHTDVHAADGDWPIKPTLPFIPGHEGAGYVAKLGPGVTHLKEGDRVGIAWLHSACGHCEFCLTGWETLCPEQQMSGYTVNGSFAEFALGQADYLGRIPDKLSFIDAAPILCAGVTTYKGLKQTQARPGEWVVISGVGGLGHVAIQYAKAMGLHVAAIDIGPEKLQLARKLGAEVTVDAKEEDVVAGDPEANRRRSRCIGDSRVSSGIQTGARNAPPWRDLRSERPASGRIPSLHFRSGAEWPNRAGFDCGHTQGSRGSAAVCRRRQGEGDHRGATTGVDQRHL